MMMEDDESQPKQEDEGGEGGERVLAKKRLNNQLLSKLDPLRISPLKNSSSVIMYSTLVPSDGASTEISQSTNRFSEAAEVDGDLF